MKDLLANVWQQLNMDVRGNKYPLIFEKLLDVAMKEFLFSKVYYKSAPSHESYKMFLEHFFISSF